MIRNILKIILIIFLFTACGSFEDFEKKYLKWADEKPASVATEKVKIINFKGSYENLYKFLRRVQNDFEFIKKQGYKIVRIEYEYGHDITNERILMSAVIFYKEKEVKNDKETSSTKD